MALQRLIQPAIGFPNPQTVSTFMSTLALSTSNIWVGFSFMLESTQTLSAVRVWFSALTGTPAASDVTCSIYADNAGAPNTGGAALEGPTNCSASPAVGANEFTGFSGSYTGHTLYWVVLKCAGANAGTKYVTVQYTPAGSGPYYGQVSATTWGWHKQHTTNGSTWANAVVNVLAMRLAFSGGLYAGLLLSNSGGATAAAYGTNEGGIMITTPAGVTLNVAGIAASVYRNGSPAGNLVFKLYAGTSLVATTGAVPKANIGANSAGYCRAYFSSVQQLAPSTTYRLSMAQDSGSDTSANSYALNFMVVDNDANSLALIPWGAQQTLYTGSWAQTQTTVPHFALLLDSNGEFTAAGGGGMLYTPNLCGT